MNKLLRIASAILLFTTPILSHAQATSESIIRSTLEGHVLDLKTKIGLEGATVQIKGTTHNATTDRNGKFSFRTGQKFPIHY